MPTYRYQDPEPRVYHDFGPLIEGATVDADQAPDHRFTQTDDTATAQPAGGASASNTTTGS
jgi:hypothetical protein